MILRRQRYNFGPHIDPEALEQYSLGRHGELDIASIEEHLLVCGRCLDKLEHTEAFIEATKGALSGTCRKPASSALSMSAGVRLRSWIMVPALATALVAIATGVVMAWHRDAQLGPAQEIALATTRGAEDIRVQHGDVALSIDTTELPGAGPFVLELVEADGSRVWSGIEEASNHRIRTTPGRNLRAGRYWLRVYANAQKTDLLREYGFLVE